MLGRVKHWDPLPLISQCSVLNLQLKFISALTAASLVVSSIALNVTIAANARRTPKKIFKATIMLAGDCLLSI